MEKGEFESDRIKNMQENRGAVIEMSISIEIIYNNIVLMTGREDMITRGFHDKTEFVKSIMKDADKGKRHFSDELFNSMDRVVSIRKLFAHVPVDYSGKEEMFDQRKYYYHPDTRSLKKRSIQSLNREFFEISGNLKDELEKAKRLIERGIKNRH